MRGCGLNKCLFRLILSLVPRPTLFFGFNNTRICGRAAKNAEGLHGIYYSSCALCQVDMGGGGGGGGAQPQISLKTTDEVV